jgi:hypothetical protein
MIPANVILVTGALVLCKSRNDDDDSDSDIAINSSIQTISSKESAIANDL